MATSQERADIRAKLASDALAAEYKTLRDEILQLYREQTQLAFTSALPLLGSLVVKDLPPVGGRWTMLAATLMLLAGISWKIRANYYKIFFIGTYLAVVHERQGKSPDDFNPGPTKAGWHTRWRRVDTKPARYPKLKGKLGRATAQADAVFIGAIAIALIILTVGNELAERFVSLLEARHGWPQWPTIAGLSPHLVTILGAGTALVSLIFLCTNLVQLWNIQKHVVNYREELELLVTEGRC